MAEQEVIPFWGPEQLELFELMTQAVDPEECVAAAMQEAAQGKQQWRDQDQQHQAYREVR